MASVTFDHASRVYPGADKPAVDQLCLDIADGEFLVLVGPSGCGKSTSLRMLAGLEDVNGGRILIGDKDVTDVPPKNRDIAMVFQNYALYPHMSVRENMGFALKIAGVSKEEINKRVEEAAKILDLEPYLDRKPKALSGGQRQRVGIARALADNPAVLLCDEPTSALDTESTAQILSLLRHVRDVAGVTVVIITHEMSVVREICDSVTLLGHGQVLQTGTLEEVVADSETPLARELVPMPLVDSESTAEGAATLDGRTKNSVLLDVVFTSHPGVPTGATVLHLASSMGADVTAGTFESLGSVQVGRLALTVPAYHADKIIEQLRKNNVHAEVRDQ